MGFFDFGSASEDRDGPRYTLPERHSDRFDDSVITLRSSKQSSPFLSEEDHGELVAVHTAAFTAAAYLKKPKKKKKKKKNFVFLLRATQDHCNRKIVYQSMKNNNKKKRISMKKKNERRGKMEMSHLNLLIAVVHVQDHSTNTRESYITSSMVSVTVDLGSFTRNGLPRDYRMIEYPGLG